MGADQVWHSTCGWFLAISRLAFLLFIVSDSCNLYIYVRLKWVRVCDTSDQGVCVQRWESYFEIVTRYIKKKRMLDLLKINCQVFPSNCVKLVPTTHN